ncbi:MAG TPA: hypothetical protein VLN91_04145, partial [Nitrospirota bacterium]|nr:hypothetical protein [Nitrospirota bacterium]
MVGVISLAISPVAFAMDGINAYAMQATGYVPKIVRAISFTDPSHPALVGTFDPATLTPPYLETEVYTSIQARGGYVYLLGYRPGGGGPMPLLRTVDFRDPAQPTATNLASLPSYPASRLDLAGDKAVVAMPFGTYGPIPLQFTVRLYDVTDPSRPAPWGDFVNHDANLLDARLQGDRI